MDYIAEDELKVLRVSASVSSHEVLPQLRRSLLNRRITAAGVGLLTYELHGSLLPCLSSFLASEVSDLLTSVIEIS